MRELIYILIGYLSGSLLFSKLSCRLLKINDIAENTCDSNLGAFNAFKNGGFACGVITLCGDILKGFIPVWLCMRKPCTYSLLTAFVLAAPVIGHIFPVFFRFRGGKGISTTFGCLLGMFPDLSGFIILAGSFIFFSVIIKIYPNFYRTILTYICSECLVMFFADNFAVKMGFTVILITVILKLCISKEEKNTFKVEILWKH